MTTKSKIWKELSDRVSDILSRMYDSDAMGYPLTEDSPELLDTINRIKNIKIPLGNGTHYHYPFPEDVAKQIVTDELNNRRTN